MSGILGVGSKSGIIGETEIDYEEGSWNLTNTNAPASESCIYTKIGNLVRCSGYFVTHALTASDATWGGLPFAPFNPGGDANRSAGGVMYYVSSNNVGVMIAASDSTFRIYDGTTLLSLATGLGVYFHLTYRSA